MVYLNKTYAVKNCFQCNSDNLKYTELIFDNGYFITCLDCGFYKLIWRELEIKNEMIL